MLKYHLTLFSLFIATAPFTDEQDFCESNGCSEEIKNNFYSKEEIPLTLSHKLLGKI